MSNGEEEPPKHWMVDVFDALDSAGGGPVHLQQIYKQVIGARRQRRDSIGDEPEATIRSTLQEYCAECTRNARRKYTKRFDVFRMDKRQGRGWWRLHMPGAAEFKDRRRALTSEELADLIHA